MKRIGALSLLIAASAVLISAFMVDHVRAQAPHSHDSAPPDTLWVCPMEDTEPKQHPGDCPTCGMHLHAHVIDADGHDITPEDVLYTCPMHPEVVQEHPGTCPECGMFLTMTTRSDRPDLVPEPDTHADHAVEGEPAPVATGVSEPVTRYKCPMHPDFVRDRPGSCGICGMDLVEFTYDPSATHSGVHGQATVTVGDAQRQRIGVRTTRVARQDVNREIRTVGRVVPDERRVTHIHTKYSGWIERLFVSYTGERVRAGDPVLEIYSPELVAAQQEYLVAYRSQQPVLTQAARRRLTLLDMTDGQIRELERSGEPRARFTIHAPHSGTVIAKHVTAGHQVSAATTLFIIADLGRVWVLADAYENDLHFIRTGNDASVTIPALGRVERGTVLFISPVVDLMSRSAPFRIELSNERGDLRPGAFVDVSIEVPLGERTVIPTEGILDSGTRRIVFVETAPGRFEPREVETGVRADGLIEIVSGVHVGEQIVTSATFFIDSESRLQAVIESSIAGEHQH